MLHVTCFVLHAQVYPKFPQKTKTRSRALRALIAAFPLRKKVCYADEHQEKEGIMVMLVIAFAVAAKVIILTWGMLYFPHEVFLLMLTSAVFFCGIVSECGEREQLSPPAP